MIMRLDMYWSYNYARSYMRKGAVVAAESSVTKNVEIIK